MPHFAKPLRPSLWARLPVIAPLCRAVGQDINLVFYLLVIGLTAVVLAVKLWGLVALTVTALAAVPFMFVFFVAVTWP